MPPRETLRYLGNGGQLTGDVRTAQPVRDEFLHSSGVFSTLRPTAIAKDSLTVFEFVQPQSDPARLGLPRLDFGVHLLRRS